MSVIDPGTRVGQSTEPASLLPDASRQEQADFRDEEPKGVPGGDKRADFWGAFGLHLLLTFIGLVVALPFVWMILTSFKSLAEVENDNWLPSVWRFVNYLNVFDTDNPDVNEQGIPLLRFLANSFFVATWVTFLQVLTSALAAFSFARLQWPGRDKVFLLYLSTMMLPGLVMSIPNYQIMITLGLVDTLPGLIIPAAFSAFGCFLLRQFMLTIPSSLDEAAEIDGASKMRLFWDIILPLSRPGVITLTIFTFMGNYNQFFWPLVMIKSESKYTLPVGLLFFNSSRGQTTHLMMAAVTIGVLPMILLFLFSQKYLVRGIQLGAVKG